MLNQFEWMLLNGDRLADAIVGEGGMCGPAADAMLTEVQKLECGGAVRQNARKLLLRKLEERGAGAILEYLHGGGGR